MKKKVVSVLLAVSMVAALAAGCGKGEKEGIRKQGRSHHGKMADFQTGRRSHRPGNAGDFRAVQQGKGRKMED